MSDALYERVAFIGLGLIAGSMSLAMRRGGLAGETTGYARSQDTREIAAEISLVDRVCDSARAAVEGADLVDIAPALKEGAVVSDVGSVKQSVLDAVLPHLPEHAHFVGTHPMAGTEHSGPRAGFAELFDSRWTLVVPVENTPEPEVEKIEELWRKMGARIERMDASHHDTVCAVVSHVPHLIAYTMVGVADDLRRVTDQEVIKFSAAGFRDFTRIAASDPTMWRDVFLTNKDATLDILGRFTQELTALQDAIRSGDGDHLHDYFTRTREIRRGIIEAGQDTAAPNFGRGKPTSE